MQEPPNAFIRLFRSLLNDRSAFYEKATNTEAQLDEMRNQMEKLEQVSRSFRYSYLKKERLRDRCLRVLEVGGESEEGSGNG